MKVGSLCSGYEGIGLGLATVFPDLEHSWFVEYDAAPSKILAHHWPDVPNYGDVKLTDWAAVEPVDILTAGYPCQPFSHAGLRKGADDPRHLWPGVARAISVLRPGVVLLENVRGHVSLGLDAVLGELAALGYDATWGVVRAADAGAPHSRARIFIVARDANSREQGPVGPLRGGQVTQSGGVGDGAAAHADCGNGRGWTEAGRLSQAAGTGDREAVSDAHGERHEWSGAARGRGRGPTDHCGDAPDAAGAGLEGCGTERSGSVTALTAHRGPVPDPHGSGQHGQPEQHAPAPTWLDSERRGHADGRGDGPDWGAYTSAIRRWEAVTGRTAPRPTEPGRTGERLSPRFVEWMMGLPAGHVTDVPGLARNAQLKALGNGVVPQQAALAVRTLLPLAVAA